MAKRQGLGKGLRSLISDDVMDLTGTPETSEKGGQLIFELDINKIRPNEDQPRKQFDKESLSELAASIEEHGVLQPLVVRPEAEGYTIVAGERRFRASRLAGLATVPVVIRDLDAKKVMEIALIENVQREDLNPVEEAMAYEKLMKTYHMTQLDLSGRIGKKRSSIANTLRMLKLPEDVRRQVLDGILSAGHAKALLTLDDPELMSSVAKTIAEHRLSVRETEKLCRGEKLKKKKTQVKDLPFAGAEKSPYIQDCELSLNEIYNTKCMINGDNAKGAFVITYDSADTYNRIYDLLIRKGGKA